VYSTPFWFTSRIFRSRLIGAPDRSSVSFIKWSPESQGRQQTCVICESITRTSDSSVRDDNVATLSRRVLDQGLEELRLFVPVADIALGELVIAVCSVLIADMEKLVTYEPTVVQRPFDHQECGSRLQLPHMHFKISYCCPVAMRRHTRRLQKLLHNRSPDHLHLRKVSPNFPSLALSLTRRTSCNHHRLSFQGVKIRVRGCGNRTAALIFWNRYFASRVITLISQLRCLARETEYRRLRGICRLIYECEMTKIDRLTDQR
jgi:hypothetical protein